MITLYYTPNDQTIRQTAFFFAFGRKFKKTHVIWDVYRLTDVDIAQTIETQKVIDWLQTVEGIGAKRREKCLAVLASCPDQVRVALSPSRLSFDVTAIDEDGTPYFFEFHEEQHVNMSVDRLTPIYDTQGNPVSVPRFIQRLYRDLWRLMHVRPFEVVWADWFEENKRSYRPSLTPGFKEHALPGKFRFSSFLNL